MDKAEQAKNEAAAEEFEAYMEVREECECDDCATCPKCNPEEAGEIPIQARLLKEILNFLNDRESEPGAMELIQALESEVEPD